MSDGDFNRAIARAGRIRNPTTACEAVLALYEAHRPSSPHVGHWRTMVALVRRVEALEQELRATKAGYPGHD